MRREGLQLLVVAACLIGVTSLAGAQSCTPAVTFSIETDSNPCSGTLSSGICNAAISKSVQYSVSFPDNYGAGGTAANTGQAGVTQTCMGESIGHEYHECWPAFDSPAVLSGQIGITTHRVSITTLPNFCGDGGAGYNEFFVCSPAAGVTTYIPSSPHSCCVQCLCGGGCIAYCNRQCGGLCLDGCTCPGGGAMGCNGSPTCPSPLILDPFDEGFHLTSVANGVKFRVLPNTPLVRMSWTDENWRNGWLALDRNGNGTIDDFTELFGNLTPQPPSKDPNGFHALAVFDDPANGGNGNGVIDPGDAVYKHLRIWIDANHNGISEPNEIHTLHELGILKIGLQYLDTPFADHYGNQFRYQGSVWGKGERERELCYDVFLQTDALAVGGK